MAAAAKSSVPAALVGSAGCGGSRFGGCDDVSSVCGSVFSDNDDDDAFGEVFMRKRPAEPCDHVQFGSDVMKRGRFGNFVAPAAAAAAVTFPGAGSASPFGDVTFGENSNMMANSAAVGGSMMRSKRTRFSTFGAQENSCLPQPKTIRHTPRAVLKRNRENPELVQLRMQNGQLRQENANLMQQNATLAKQNTVFKMAVPRFNARCQQKDAELQQLRQQLAQAKAYITQIEQALNQPTQFDRCGSDDWYTSNRPPDVC